MYYIYIICTFNDKLEYLTSASSFLLPEASKSAYGMQIQKEVKSNPKQQCSPQKGYGEKRFEIQGGGQEMVVMVR